MSRGRPPKRGPKRRGAPKRGGARRPDRRGPSSPAGATGSSGAKRAVKGLGGDQVEGRHAVRELLLAGRRRVREVLIASDVDQADIIDEIVDLARDAKVPVRMIGRGALEREARSEAPQGVVARAESLEPIPLESLARVRGGRQPLILVLDGIVDPNNLGAIIRTADGAGVTGVVLPRHRAARVTPSATKAAAGAIEHVPMAHVGGIPAALATLSEEGVWIVGLDEGGSGPLWGMDLADQPVAVVVGAEGAGLGRLVRQRCDAVASIPLQGALPSLNAGVAAAVACFEIVRQRAEKG